MNRRLLIIAILLVPPGTTAIVSKLQRYPHRFAEVEPGRFYRGGYPSAEHIRHLDKDKHIRTIISLTSRIDSPEEYKMLQTAKQLNIRRLPFPMPGNGCGEFVQLDRAADAMNDPSNWPVFFHCKAGKQRSNALLAAYRMRHCGWTVDQTLEELKTHYDLDSQKEQVLVEHLRNYAKHLGLPSDAARLTYDPLANQPKR